MAGIVTFAEFKQQLKFEMGENTMFSSHSDLGNLYGRWINTAYLTLTTTDSIQGVRGHLYFPELMTEDDTQSTADGTKTLNTPSDTVYIEGIWDTTNDLVLDQIGWHQYKSYLGRGNSDSRGKPTEWTRRGSYLFLHPIPDDVYACTIYYKKTPTVLTDSNTTEIGPEWDEALLKLAVVQSLMKLKRYEEAAIEKKGWAQLMYGLVGMYDIERRDRINQIRINVYDRDYSF